MAGPSGGTCLQENVRFGWATLVDSLTFFVVNVAWARKMKFDAVQAVERYDPKVCSIPEPASLSRK
jgi:hypothetical protein